ncbi:hypothetical protein [Sulfurimonas sp.]|uniref:hypothetical protein n=1 Tax=Sulfurimonas sp. TaxID=2022749 RepID=UPI003D0E04C4
MKNLLLSVLLLFSTIAFAKEYTKAEEEAMLQNLLKMCKKTDEMKKETESIKKVGKKLDEIVNVIEKDKK